MLKNEVCIYTACQLLINWPLMNGYFMSGYKQHEKWKKKAAQNPRSKKH